MKAPTLRANGEHMITMRVEYTFGFQQLVDALAIFAYDNDWVDRPLEPGMCSKQQCEAAIHRSFREYGLWASMRNGDVLDQIGNGSELREWASTEVARLYPTLMAANERHDHEGK